MIADDVAALLLEFKEKQDARDAAFAAYANGTIDGGPNHDGYYPLPSGNNQFVLSPCPALQTFMTRELPPLVLSGVNAITLDPAVHHARFLNILGTTATANVTVSIPEGIRPGFHCMFAGVGTGRIIFAMLGGGFLRQDQGFDRTRAARSVAGLYSASRDSSGRSTVYLYGSLATA